MSINLLHRFFFQSVDILKRAEQCALSALRIVTRSKKILETVKNQLETHEITLIHQRIFCLVLEKQPFISQQQIKYEVKMASAEQNYLNDQRPPQYRQLIQLFLSMQGKL